MTVPLETPRPIALVTGARRGIGRGIALALARQGFDIAFTDIADDEQTHATRALLADCGVRALFVRHDVADIDSHDSLVERVAAELGPISCLVNNAGISVSTRGDLLDCTPQSFDALLGTNLRGPFFLTRKVAAHLLATDSAGHYRCIINVSSANAFAASLNRGEYCLSKAAITMSTRLFAARLGESGVGVFEIRPGVIRTDMTAVAQADYDARIAAGLSPIRRWGTPEDVGRAAAALAGGAFAFSTGDAIHVDGGLHIQRL